MQAGTSDEGKQKRVVAVRRFSVSSDAAGELCRNLLLTGALLAQALGGFYAPQCTSSCGW